MYFKKLQIILLKLLYQTGPKLFSTTTVNALISTKKKKKSKRPSIKKNDFVFVFVFVDNDCILMYLETMILNIIYIFNTI